MELFPQQLPYFPTPMYTFLLAATYCTITL